MLKLNLLAASACVFVTESLAETRVIGEAAISSGLHDRGEQIGPLTLETELLLETTGAHGTLYGGLYRLTPIGADQAAFADETDYVIGYQFDIQGGSMDLTASWLTYPGTEDEESLELAASFTSDLPYSPALAVFHDATLGDFGAEVSAGPSWKSGAWDAYVLARAGFVDAGDESGGRSYAGLELGAARPLGQQAEIGLYARYDISDADSFAREINQGVVTEFASSGLAVGAVIGVVIP